MPPSGSLKTTPSAPIILLSFLARNGCSEQATAVKKSRSFCVSSRFACFPPLVFVTNCPPTATHTPAIYGLNRLHEAHSTETSPHSQKLIWTPVSSNQRSSKANSYMSQSSFCKSSSTRTAATRTFSSSSCTSGFTASAAEVPSLTKACAEIARTSQSSDRKKPIRSGMAPSLSVWASLRIQARRTAGIVSLARNLLHSSPAGLAKTAASLITGLGSSRNSRDKALTDSGLSLAVASPRLSTPQPAPPASCSAVSPE